MASVILRTPRAQAVRVSGGRDASNLLLKLVAAVLFLVLPMAAIVYSGAWFWPKNGVDFFFSLEPTGLKEFRTILWGLIAFSTAAVVMRPVKLAFAKGFSPYALFFAAACLSTLQGDDPASSAWFLTLWLAMACAGLSVGVLAAPRWIGFSAATLFALVPLISLTLLAVHPSWVTMSGGKMLLRGLFQHKNAAGAFSAVGILFLLTFQPRLWSWARWGAIMLALLMLLLSRSVTAMGAFAAALAALATLRLLRALRAPLLVKVAILLGAVGAAAGLVGILLPIIIAATEKTQSLAGRQSGWNMYWRFFQGHLLLGRGPGAFVTGASVINQMISRLIVNDLNMSVHDAYLALLGEVGLVGLGCYLSGLVYLAFVAPLKKHANTADVAAAVLAAYVLASSFTEAKETLAPGLATFLIMVCRGAAEVSRRRPRASSALVRLQQEPVQQVAA